jgi:hypothetical protein
MITGVPWLHVALVEPAGYKAKLSCMSESEVVLRINALQMWFLSEHMESMT